MWRPKLIKPRLSTCLVLCTQTRHRINENRHRAHISSLSGGAEALTQPHTPSLLLTLSVFVGLPIALWAYKCAMMVLFQRKIIYMGYAPLGARTEELKEFIRFEHHAECREIVIESTSNVKLAGLLMKRESTTIPETVVLYLQGNAGSPLHRIPVFETLLDAWPKMSSTRDPRLKEQQNIISDPKLAIVAVAPRSYWKSTNKAPTERGLLDDYLSVLNFVLQTFPSARVVVYGHSLGAAVSVCLLAQLEDGACAKMNDRVRGLILENPFASIPGMVRALYPQRWLPYHYLAPFAFDKWDALYAARNANNNSVLYRLKQNHLIVLSEKDELVPREMGEQIWNALGSTGRKVVIERALHENAWSRPKWAREMRLFIDSSCQ